jgi:hypothetical protein
MRSHASGNPVPLRSARCSYRFSAGQLPPSKTDGRRLRQDERKQSRFPPLADQRLSPHIKCTKLVIDSINCPTFAGMTPREDAPSAHSDLYPEGAERRRCVIGQEHLRRYTTEQWRTKRDRTENGRNGSGKHRTAGNRSSRHCHKRCPKKKTGPLGPGSPPLPQDLGQ